MIRQEWKFAIGDRCEHVSGGLKATVTGRFKTAMGREICVLRDGEGRERHISGDFLKLS